MGRASLQFSQLLRTVSRWRNDVPKHQKEVQNPTHQHYPRSRCPLRRRSNAEESGKSGATVTRTKLVSHNSQVLLEHRVDKRSRHLGEYRDEQVSYGCIEDYTSNLGLATDKNMVDEEAQGNVEDQIADKPDLETADGLGSLLEGLPAPD